MAIKIQSFFHEQSSTISYVVFDNTSKEAFIVDSVLDFDLESGQVAMDFADKQLSFINQNNLSLVYIFETHAHADHLTAASYLRDKTSAKVAVSANIVGIQKHFKLFFNDNVLTADGRSFDLLLNDHDSLSFGNFSINVMSVPGHTNDSIALVIDGNVFVGDTLFMPDQGTARCDFPGGDANKLFESVTKLHALPDHFTLWMCHDYQPGGRELAYKVSVKESRLQNIHINENSSEYEFVETREARDATLNVPKLLYPAIQVNIHAGELPMAETNGRSFLKIPLAIAD